MVVLCFYFFVENYKPMLLFNFGKLTEYPFNAEVWGTVSDWVMIFVTAGTAYLLWRTFRSQNDSIDIQNRTLMGQQEFNLLQEEINRVTVIPLITIHNIKRTSDTSQSVTLILNKNPAYLFAVFKNDVGYFAVGFEHHLGVVNNWPEGGKITIENIATITDSPKDMVFSYRDISNRLYVQFLRLEINGRFMLSTPFLKTEEELNNGNG